MAENDEKIENEEENKEEQQPEEEKKEEKPEEEKSEEEQSSSEKPETVKQERRETDRNIVYVGSKPFMNYVTGVVMQFNSGMNKVIIKARGKYISRAVDIEEVVKNRFMQGVKLDSVKIGSDEFKNREGRTVRASTVELTLSK